VAFVKKTAKLLDIESSIRIVQGDVFKFATFATEKYDYIFAGPPYGLPALDTIPNVIFEKQLLAAEGIFVMEHNPNHNFENHPNFWQSRNYGTTIFSFFQSTVSSEA
jgi:16S rRNA G966 N2-methylase RsmD